MRLERSGRRHPRQPAASESLAPGAYQLTEFGPKTPKLLTRIREQAADPTRPLRERLIASRLALLPQTLMLLEEKGVDTLAQELAEKHAAEKGSLATPEDFFRTLLIAAYTTADIPNFPNIRNVLLTEIDDVTRVETIS